MPLDLVNQVLAQVQLVAPLNTFRLFLELFLAMKRSAVRFFERMGPLTVATFGQTRVFLMGVNFPNRPNLSVRIRNCLLTLNNLRITLDRAPFLPLYGTVIPAYAVKYEIDGLQLLQLPSGQFAVNQVTDMTQRGRLLHVRMSIFRGDIQLFQAPAIFRRAHGYVNYAPLALTQAPNLPPVANRHIRNALRLVQHPRIAAVPNVTVALVASAIRYVAFMRLRKRRLMLQLDDDNSVVLIAPNVTIVDNIINVILEYRLH